MMCSRLALFAVLFLSVTSAGAEEPSTTVLRLGGRGTEALKEDLVEIVRKHVEPFGFFVESSSAWLAFSRPLPPADSLEVLWLEPAKEVSAMSPFAFELRPVGEGVRPTVMARLAVTLRREVLLATHPMPAGSRITCADLRLERRSTKLTPADARKPPCEIATGTVTLRDLGSGDALRTNDIGLAPEITAWTRVHLTITNGSISVATTALALQNGTTGQRVDVRLERPTRTLRTRVIGAGTVELLDESL